MPSPEQHDVSVRRLEGPIDVVLEALGDIVETPPENIDPTMILTALGIDSYTAVRLRRRLFEDTDVGLELTDFLGDATASSIAAHIERRRADLPVPAPRPSPTVDEEKRDERASFELGAVQQAYLVGREPAFPLGGVATYYYYEYDRVADDAHADLRKLETAWNAVVRRHPMLRFVVDPDARGVVRESVPDYRIDVTDLTATAPDECQRRLDEARRENSHRVLPVDTGPLYDIRAALLPGGITRLFVGFDILALDMAGWIALMREWGERVGGRTEFDPLGASFVDILEARAIDPDHQRARARDLDYWTAKAQQLPPGPELPWLADPRELGVPRFARESTELTAQQWDSLQQACASRGLTPTAVLLASFALTLRCWGATENFALNTTLFDREHDTANDAQSTADSIGDFTTTVLVEMPSVDRGDFASFCAAVNHRFWSDMDHRTVSGVEVLRLRTDRLRTDRLRTDRLRTDRIADASLTPTHPVVFTSGLGLSDSGDGPTEWLGSEVFGVSQTPQVLLDHIVREDGGRLRVAWDTVEGALNAQFVRSMADAHARLLSRLADDDLAWTDTTLTHDPTFRPPEPVTPSTFDAHGPLLTDPFDASTDGSAPAIVSGTAELTVDHVRKGAAQIAAALAARGIGPGDAVAVSADKSSAQIIAVLGVAASGAAYVPVEPSWPAERIASVVRQANIAHALISTDTNRSRWPDGIDVDTFDAAGRLSPVGSENLEGAATPRRPDTDDLAYVIFTSGSTGEPKGVAIEHRAARTTLDDLMGRYPLTADDRVLALSAFSFDLSVFDIFSVLGAGGALILPDTARLRDPGHWLDVMARHRVTLWNTAPALLEMLVEYAEIEPERARRALGTLRLVFLSGDYIPTTLPDRLRALAPGATVVSLGGATEAAIWSIFHPIGHVDPEWKTIPYGRALGGQTFHVLDDGVPCAVGQPGELYIGGSGLAREYIGNPEQTAARFFVHPATGLRLYRTGDLGRWRTDGSIEFLGRVDRQVKIAGHRIELGEIDSTLERLPQVRAAVASAMPGPDDRPRLICFIVDSVTGTAAADADLVGALEEHLPPYMIPSRFVRLPSLPVTPNGKVDHRALPNPFKRETVPVVSAPVDPTPSTAMDVVADALARGLELRITVTAGALSPRRSLDAGVAWADNAVQHLRDIAEVDEVHSTDGLLELHIRGTEPEAAVVETAPTPSTVGADPAIEKQVSDTFAELLGEHINATTPFFDVGATSLTLVLAHRRLSADHPTDEFTVIDLFAHPTVASLASFLSGLAGTPRTQAPAPERALSSTSDHKPSNAGRSRRDARLAARMHAAEVTR
ncbi:MAG: amino acid adenylation domain-containing protein [Rhodococcus sp. (in: high G+C Gram-positive bacteria)]